MRNQFTVSTFDRLLAELDGAPGNRARACARRALFGPEYAQVSELRHAALAGRSAPFGVRVG
jgi:hypothetical protein